MIELAFVVCLKAQLHLCEERSFAYLPDMTLFSCMMQAQPQLAAWSESNPHLTVTRWTCRSIDRREVKA